MRNKYSSHFIKTMKNLFGFLTSLLLLLQFVSPAFAKIPSGAIPLEWRPNYKEQVEYIINNKCESNGIVPYYGYTYYTCPSGEKFWAEVLVPVDNSILYFKNRDKHSDEY